MSGTVEVSSKIKKYVQHVIEQAEGEFFSADGNTALDGLLAVEPEPSDWPELLATASRVSALLSQGGHSGTAGSAANDALRALARYDLTPSLAGKVKAIIEKVASASGTDGDIVFNSNKTESYSLNSNKVEAAIRNSNKTENVQIASGGIENYSFSSGADDDSLSDAVKLAEPAGKVCLLSVSDAEDDDSRKIIIEASNKVERFFASGNSNKTEAFEISDSSPKVESLFVMSNSGQEESMTVTQGKAGTVRSGAGLLKSVMDADPAPDEWAPLLDVALVASRL